MKPTYVLGWETIKRVMQKGELQTEIVDFIAADDLLRASEHMSDGYHTFAELYEHRHALYLLAASLLDAEDRRLGEIRRCWKAKAHHDGTTYPGWSGWFLAGITDPRIRPISYHLPLDWWGKIPGTEIEKAPPYDGHTSQQVAVRVQGLGILLQHVASVNP